MSKKLGLALGGGSANGAAHIGVLRALEEAEIRPDYISGCSIGAVIGACFAHGMTALEIREEVLKLKTRSIADFSLGFIRRKSLFSTKKVKKLLLKYIGEGDIEDFQIPFSCIATDAFNAQTVVLDHGPAVQSVLASLAVPCVFRPVEMDGTTLIDGSVLCRVPSRYAKDMGADVVVSVDVLKNTEDPPEKIKNIFSMIMRAYELMDLQITRKTKALEEGVYDLYIEPDMSGLSPYAVKDLDVGFNRGYEAATAAMPQIIKLLED
ncbi:MAG: patatin-like phospholipase family protein [Clostridia bacterium]|nr:patatin-like phospholipase family protein [Clostridia bacterium]